MEKKEENAPKTEEEKAPVPEKVEGKEKVQDMGKKRSI